jgi:hypothetical protein
MPLSYVSKINQLRNIHTLLASDLGASNALAFDANPQQGSLAARGGAVQFTRDPGAFARLMKLIAAQLGNASDEAAGIALATSMHCLWPDQWPQMQALPQDWPGELDRLLTRLSGLSDTAKAALLQALQASVESLGITPTERQ